jgi:hypothetical protein
MTIRILAVFVFIVCAGIPPCLPARAQGQQPVSGPASSYVPTYTFQLDRDHRTEYPMSSGLYEEWPQCTEDGTVFIDLYFDTPSHFSEEVLFALGPDGKKTAYLYEDIPDLYDLAGQVPFSVDVTDAGISFLLYATRDSAKEFPTAGKGPRYTGDHYWYIARFDRNGSYKNSFAIDIPHFEPARIAQFDTGQYLVLGFDTLELVPKLAMLDSDGQLRSFLNPPKSLPIKSPFQEPQLNPSASKDRHHFFRVQQAVRDYQLGHHGSAIDLLEPGSQGPIFEVFADGSVNAIPVQPHSDYELDSIIPSNGKTLFVRFAATTNKFLEPSQGTVEEIDITDGTPLKQISLPGLSPWDILCIRDSKAQILRSRQTPTGSIIFDIYQADLVPAAANAAQ